MSVIDHLESDLEAKIQGSRQLRQAILRHAFTGQLVPQNADDEPASALLARVAAARAERGVQTSKAWRPRAARKRRTPPLPLDR